METTLRVDRGVDLKYHCKTNDFVKERVVDVSKSAAGLQGLLRDYICTR